MTQPRGSREHHRSVLTAVDAFLTTQGPEWISRQRWFADKGRAIADLSIDGLLVDRFRDDDLAMCVVAVRFEQGYPEKYLLPLAVTRSPRESGTEPAALLDSGKLLVDATEMEWFGSWLMRLWLEGASTTDSAWSASLQASERETVARLLGNASRRIGGEQSNTSLMIGDHLIVKLIRRLQPGPNPEEEILQALAKQQFPHVPPFAGAISWVSPDGLRYSVALGQRFVPNRGDGWSWILQRLTSGGYLMEGSRNLDFKPERLLGQRTAELHLALANVHGVGFTSTPLDEATANANTQRTLDQLEDALALLEDRSASLPELLRPQLPDIVEGLEALADLTEGFREEHGNSNLRVHGDYHLGQVLRTEDDDWSIIDFEGEPARSVDERRQRTSALKDVAGMLRSFSYARAAADQASEPGRVQRRRKLADWEVGARNAFLEGYRVTIPSDAALIPTNDEGFFKALRAWELEKALYEIAYEARNRPDWLFLPLSSLLPWVGDQLAEAGGAPA